MDACFWLFEITTFRIAIQEQSRSRCYGWIVYLPVSVLRTYCILSYALWVYYILHRRCLSVSLIAMGCGDPRIANEQK